MSGLVANELSAFACGVATQNCEFDSGTFPCQLRRTLRNGFYLLVDQDPVFIVVCQLPWAVEDGQRVVEVSMDLDRGLDVMAPVPVRRDLQFHPLEGDAVIAADDPVVLFAQEVMILFINGLQWKRYKRLEFTVTGETACADSWGRALMYREPSLSIPCFGERRYGGVAEDELLMALPPEELDRGIEGLTGLSKAGLRYPIPPYGIQADPAEGLGISYDLQQKKG